MNEYITYIGIDVGKKGGIGILLPNGDVQAFPLEYLSMSKILADFSGKSAICFVEKVHSMPNQGVKSTFTFGWGLGYVEGVLCSLNIPYELVSVNKWKNEFSLTSDKSKSIEVCKKLFPTVSLLPTERSRVDNDGMAEALLLAEYARRKYVKD